MKKTAVVLTVVSLVFLMAACSMSGAERNDTDQTAETADEKNNESNSMDSEEVADETSSETNGDSQVKADDAVTDGETTVGTKRDQGDLSKGAKQEAAKESDKASEVRDADSQPLTKKEAEELVRNYLELTNRPEVKVQYDHDEQGRYVIHVYEIVGEGEGSHTATLGWYYVDPKSQEIESMF